MYFGDGRQLPNNAGRTLFTFAWTLTSSLSVGTDTHEPQACKDESGASLLQSIVQAVSENEHAKIKSTLERIGDNRAVDDALNASRAQRDSPEDSTGSTDEALEDFLMADRLSDGNVENDYDCAMDWENWEVVWTDAKKEWCCKHKQIGCPDAVRTGRGSEWGDVTDQNSRRRRRRGENEAKNTRSMKPPDNKTCVTRKDPRVSSDLGYEAAPPGTRCVFGVDKRDEGWHCIMDGGRFGSNGWCFTNSNRAMWGSCDDGCPLSGQAKVLGDRVENISVDIDRLANSKSARIPSVVVPYPV